MSAEEQGSVLNPGKRGRVCVQAVRGGGGANLPPRPYLNVLHYGQMALRYTRRSVGNIFTLNPLVWQLCELNG